VHARDLAIRAFTEFAAYYAFFPYGAPPEEGEVEPPIWEACHDLIWIRACGKAVADAEVNALRDHVASKLEAAVRAIQGAAHSLTVDRFMDGLPPE
jgi:hypothetical protein